MVLRAEGGCGPSSPAAAIEWADMRFEMARLSCSRPVRPVFFVEKKSKKENRIVMGWEYVRFLRVGTIASSQERSLVNAD